ncbi:MAG: peptidoglycan DD-metalloendopeptidase family protein [Clostridiaceae bacterium]|jgi:murein DD-endopeptidase MepM/ murein hydrolase activator NlpD|nr:peptidoglycan DD-metalloendopeptidase family protein [Clostridiaceae bacterium]
MKKFDKRLLMIPMVLITTVIVVVMLIRSTKAFEVLLDDKPIGIVESQAVFGNLVESIRKNAENRYGTEIMISNKIDYKEVYLPDNKRVINVYSPASLSELEQSVALKAKVFVINVDGKDIAIFRDKATAEGILERVKAPYVENAGDGVVTTFAENVSIIERVVASGELNMLSDPDEVYSSITKENEAIRKYVVQKGDTVSEIAEKLGVRQKDIEKANPDLNIDRISIGQELSLSVPRYLINIKQSIVKEYEDSVPYDVSYEESDELYKGNTEVKVEGVEGKKTVKAELISINGIPEETRVLSEVVTVEPKAAIVLKGTKPRPRTLAYGVFNWPSRGSITSRFGARWGEQHSGIDIAAPKGSPNKAADGGVVKFAGWSGNYGKLVIIDHENGYTTYYGHNNTIKVKVGQRVARGDVIGTVGETGRATGPHLHFEVRKNGVPVNPLKYIN